MSNLFKFALEYTVRKVQETNLGLVLAYADDVNLIGGDIRTIERNADVLLNACKDIGLAVNIGKTVHGNRTSSRRKSKCAYQDR